MVLKSFSKESPLLLTPGPVLLHPKIKESLSLPMIHHRDKDFKSILFNVSRQLKSFFQTKAEVILLNATGTGAMEAGLLNTLSPQDEVLCVGGGKFGERWQDMAKKLSLKVHNIDVPWGEAVKGSQIEEALKKHPQSQALILTACETSTASSHPVKEVAEVLEKHPEVLFIVDAITALGSMVLDMDDWGIDVMVAGSQKTFWLPTGLSFISLSKKAWDRSLHSKLPKYYFDLTREKKAQKKGQTAFSSPVTLIRALDSSLKILSKMGLKNLIGHSESLKKACLDFGSTLGLKTYSSQPANSVTAFLINEANEIKKVMEKEHHIIMGGGQGPLKNKILRLGHLGPIEKEVFLMALEKLGEELKKRSLEPFTKKQLEMALKKAQTHLEPLTKEF